MTALQRCTQAAVSHCVYCMHLAVLAQRMATCSAERDGSGCALFLRAPQPGERERYPWADLESPVALAIGASAPHVAGHAAWVAGVSAQSWVFSALSCSLD